MPPPARLLWLPPLVLAAALLALLRAPDAGAPRRPGRRPAPAPTVVGYSPRKRAELEGARYACAETEGGGTGRGARGGFEGVPGTGMRAWSAALDDRAEPYSFARIVAVIEGKWSEPVYCQIRSANGTYHVVKPTIVPMWEKEWDRRDRYAYFNPVLVSCRIPLDVEASSVSLSSEPCKISTVKFPLIRKGKKKRKNFTICVKPLNFLEDISSRLIQWIEINKLLGADHFHIFVGRVNRNVSKILKWYSSKYPTTFTVKKFQPVALWKKPVNFSFYLWQKRRYESVTYNSCFYENLNSKFVVPLDIDEIIVPKTKDTWKNLLEELPNHYTNYIVRNTYYFTKPNEKYGSDNIFFLNNTKRASLLSEKTENCKSFISTSEALTVFNHYALKSVSGGTSKSYFLPFEIVQLNHYKSSCKSVILSKCEHFLSSPRIEDPVILKYRSQFLENYRKVLNGVDKL